MGKISDSGRSGTTGTGEVASASVRSHSIFIEQRPHPKERPRAAVSKAGKTFMYTPAKTIQAEKDIAAAWDGPVFEGEVAVHIVVDKEGMAIIVEQIDIKTKSSLRGDIDNYVKTILDGLNGVAWKDDSQVVKLTAIKA
jgi:crossover junction endodeoxyribonuclease RusA